LARTSDDRVVLAGGAEGLFRIDLENYELQQVPNGSKDTIGAVRDITSSHYAGFDIVDAANGTYSLSDKGLSSFTIYRPRATHHGCLSSNTSTECL